MCGTLEALSETTIAEKPTASRSRIARCALSTSAAGVAPPCSREDLLLERAGVDADAERAAARERPPRDLLQARGPADVPGVDAHLVRAGLDAGDRQPVVEVDVGDERQRDPRADAREGRERAAVGHRDPADLAAGPLERAQLAHRRADVAGVGLRHRLHAHRRAAADGHRADAHRDGPARPPPRSAPRRGTDKAGLCRGLLLHGVLRHTTWWPITSPCSRSLPGDVVVEGEEHEQHAAARGRPAG